MSVDLMEEAAELVSKYDSVSAAARAAGIPDNTLRHRYKKYKERQAALGNLSPDQAQTADAMGIPLSQLQGGWVKTKEASFRFKVPEPAKDPGRLAEALREGLKGATPAKPVPLPLAPSELLAIFPVADLHMGMLADEEEVGQDWDTKKAQEVFSATLGRLIEVTPAAGACVLAQLGDLTHNDDQRNVTPQSGHQLDVDSRYFMILRRAVASMKWAIDQLRNKYPKVIYRGQRGNHDMTTHYAVTLALAEHYRDIPEVEIVQSANEYYCHEFGKNMVLLHHGDRAKPERLTMFAASEYPEVWGRTKHRMAFSGHVHHVERKEAGGMMFESVGTLAPRDAHAYGHGYSAGRYLSSVTLHETDGEISRARVNV